jgi:hypothetical protein
MAWPILWVIVLSSVCFITLDGRVSGARRGQKANGMITALF